MANEWLNVSAITPRIAYTATASQTAFTVPFVFFSNTDLAVYQNEVLLTLYVDYTVTGAENESGGTVTLITGATVGDEIMIVRHVAIEQTTHIPPSGPLDVAGINFQISKLVAIDQQQQDEIERSLHFPDSDGTASGELGSVASRANRLLGFGTDGEIIYPLGPTYVGETSTGVAHVDSRATAQVTTFGISVNVVITGGYASPSDGGGAVYVRGSGSGSFNDAGAVAWKLDLGADAVSPLWFGAKGDGTTDDTTAFQATITASSGKRIDGQGLTYKITTTLTGVDNIEITNATLLQGAHPAAHPIITFVNKTNWQIRNVWFKSSYPTTLDYSISKIGAVHFSNTTSTDLENIAIEDCTFSDFADNYWIFGSITGTGDINDFRFCRNRILSTGVGSGANYVSEFHALLNLFATDPAANAGWYVNPIVEDNHGDFNDVGIGFALWSRNRGFRINRNVIRNVGANSLFTGSSKDTNCYGILVYDTFGAPGSTTTTGIDGVIAHNYVLNPPSTGIYLVAAQNVDIHDNIVMGQFRTDDDTLPRAGISLNDGRRCKVHHNRIIDCWGGVAVVSLFNSDVTEVSDNYIRSNTVTDAYGIRIGSTPGTGTTAAIAIRRNRIETTGATSLGLWQISDASNFIGPLTIEGNTFVSAFKAVDIAAIKTNGTITIRNNKYSGVASGGCLVVNAITSAMIVQGETFDLQTNTGGGINLDSSTNIAFVDSLFINKTSGAACVTALGATGTMEGIKFRFVSGLLRVVASSMGYTIPAFSGITGDIVQDISSGAYTEAGSTPKYTILGWVCVTGTTWLPRRLPTGN